MVEEGGVAEMSIRLQEGFFFCVLQIQFKGTRRRSSSRSCRANAAAQGHMSQPSDIKEERQGRGGRKPSTTDMHTHRAELWGERESLQLPQIFPVPVRAGVWGYSGFCEGRSF